MRKTTLKRQHRDFIARQQMFFVATAPLAPDGHINVSPKGLDAFAVLDNGTVAYIDLGGSGIETHAHLRENGRICIMFCAFDGDPLILRLYGRGEAFAYGTPEFEALRPQFPAIECPVRGIMRIAVTRIAESCGWGVPLYEYQGQRSRLVEHNSSRTQEAFFARRLRTGAKSIDGLPGLTA